MDLNPVVVSRGSTRAEVGKMFPTTGHPNHTVQVIPDDTAEYSTVLSECTSAARATVRGRAVHDAAQVEARQAGAAHRAS